jgi:hypothetical protein
MRLELLAARHRSLAVTACEWRAFGLADPDRMADEAFDRLLTESDPTLADLYDAIDRVVQLTYERHAAGISIIERLGKTLSFERTGRRDPNELLTMLSQLRGKHREVLQLRYWDGLSDAEAAEVLRIDPGKLAERRVKAEAKLLAKVNKNYPEVIALDVPELVASIKPGHHTRNAAD